LKIIKFKFQIANWVIAMFDFPSLRQQFPSLNQKVHGRIPIFFDGPGGTQTPQRVIDAITHYLSTCNANHGGAFTTSRESDAILERAHARAAELIHAPSWQEIVFGPNMTTLTLHLSRAFARTLRPMDEIVVTRMDHDANVAPWILAARDAGATVRTIDVHPEDCTLDLDDLGRQLNERTRLVAVACASNAVGTINDVRRIIQSAHQVGAKVFLDAVHYAPHGPIDVQEWDCDFLACSAYKFFGPHVGILWGRRNLLEELPAYKLRPVPEELPQRWMTGTQNHEGLAGVVAAIDYLAEIGSKNPDYVAKYSSLATPCREIHAGLAAIRDYELSLCSKLLDGLAQRRRLKIRGIQDRDRLRCRVPTISITSSDHTTQQIAAHLAAREIYVWNGNMYAIGLSERLDLERQGGFLRIGLVHYNTLEEIDRLMEALDAL
jgi:cysteine desulfurase family protein (TIGR01976 family)